MKRSQRLQVLTRLTDSAERLARIHLARATQDVQRKQAQQQQLEAYLGEYQQSLLESGRLGLSGEQLARHQLFLGSLDKTIDTQKLAVARARQGVSQSTAVWHAQRNRQKVFHDLVERAQSDELREDARREQKDMDELGTRRAHLPDPQNH